MVFSSAIFLFVFLPAFLIGLIVTARLGAQARNLNIVVFSLAFYVFGGGIYSLILVGSVLFNWSYARFVVARARSGWLLAIGVVLNLAPLLVFKYLDFLLEITTRYFFRPFLHSDLPILELFLPVGISFYTFQAISYLIDVHRRDTEPEPRPITFAAYLLFFPQLVAGPIVRYVEVKDGFQRARVTLDGFNAGIFYFGIGLARKMLIADPIGRQVDLIYATPPAEISNFMAWFASIGYFLQIFFDFAGYSEMAIGMGLMAGLSFPDNFQQPHRAHSITDFWRRWHMTLTRWFRDYVYIPLGGNRRGPARNLINLFFVFVLCGLWHGAALTFVAWGAYHGTLLVIERVLSRSLGIEPRGLVGATITTLLVAWGLVIFRSESFDQAGMMLSKILFVDRSGVSPFVPAYYATPYMTTVFAAALILSWLPTEKWHIRKRVTGRWAAVAAMLGVLLCAMSAAALAAEGFNPFIYFRF